MRTRDVVAQLQQRGGDRARATDGPVLTWDLGDRLLQVLPRVRESTASATLDLHGSVTTDAFDAATAAIFEPREPGRAVLIARFGGGSEARAPRITPEFVDERLDAEIAWARGIDLEASMAALHERRGDWFGSLPLHHLAALALAGDVDAIEAYLPSYDRGEPAFPPYLDRAAVERAAALARAHRG